MTMYDTTMNKITMVGGTSLTHNEDTKYTDLN